jgi:rubredoxin
MTLLPSNEHGIRGHKGNAYDVNAVCSHPSCTTPSAHAHHCWSRSFLRGQPYEWVMLPDGAVIGNRLGFCAPHHEMLTGEIGGYRARLIWDAGIMWWEDRHFDHGKYLSSGWDRPGPTSTQPPVAGEEIHESLPDGEVCPTCGHHKKQSDRSQLKPGKLRPTKDWVLAVPDDAEVGADLLDEWIEDFAIVFGMDEYTSRLKRYHVISVLRGATYALRKEIIALFAEAAEKRVA